MEWTSTKKVLRLLSLHYGYVLHNQIENSVPYQQIYIDKSQNKIDDSISDERTAEIEAKARILINIALSMGGNDRKKVIENMFCSEPFSKYPALKEKLQEE